MPTLYGHVLQLIRSVCLSLFLFSVFFCIFFRPFTRLIAYASYTQYLLLHTRTWGCLERNPLVSNRNNNSKQLSKSFPERKRSKMDIITPKISGTKWNAFSAKKFNCRPKFPLTVSLMLGSHVEGLRLHSQGNARIKTTLSRDSNLGASVVGRVNIFVAALNENRYLEKSYRH